MAVLKLVVVDTLVYLAHIRHFLVLVMIVFLKKDEKRKRRISNISIIDIIKKKLYNWPSSIVWNLFLKINIVWNFIWKSIFKVVKQSYECCINIGDITFILYPHWYTWSFNYNVSIIIKVFNILQNKDTLHILCIWWVICSITSLSSSILYCSSLTMSIMGQHNLHWKLSMLSFLCLLFQFSFHLFACDKLLPTRN